MTPDPAEMRLLFEAQNLPGVVAFLDFLTSPKGQATAHMDEVLDAVFQVEEERLVNLPAGGWKMATIVSPISPLDLLYELSLRLPQIPAEDLALLDEQCATLALRSRAPEIKAAQNSHLAGSAN